MAPRSKKKLEPSAPMTRADALVSRLKKNKDDRDVYCARDLMKGWRYVDFMDPKLNRPCIALEWEFGCRGLLAGRMARLIAKYGVGKSSLMWLMYACAQQPQFDGWCYHLETEGAPPPPDFMWSFGCDPSKLVVEQPKSLEQAFEYIDQVVAEIRGGFGGSMDKTTGKRKKSKFTEPLDPENLSPIVCGVDSFSALGLDTQVEEDVLDLRKSPALATHSRKVAEYLRDRSDRFKTTQALMLLAAQEKTMIKTGPAAFGGGSGKTSLADAAIGFHATYSVDLTGNKYVDKATGIDIGEKIRIYTTKNKLSPKHREITLFLVRDQGFDLAHTDAEFLIAHPASPIVASRHSHGVKCEALSSKSFKNDNDFLDAFYANTDMLMTCREQLRIRGLGFDFETKYMPTPEEIQDNKESPVGESVIHGVEGSTEPVPKTEDAE